MTNPAAYAAQLASLEARRRRRELRPAAGVDFTSNDYLGLAASPRLRDALRAALDRGVPVGAGGSRLLRGNDPEHERLEAEAAAFFGAARTLLFGSGYAANVALLATLPQREDLVVFDERIHASAHDGMRLSRAERAAFRHNDPDDARRLIGSWRTRGGAGRPWIAVESLYSMDGDRAPLETFRALADASDGFLIVDEAHATGVFGPGGRGLANALEGRENVVVLHTGGKALGVGGALVNASRLLCDFLVNRARPFVFATAPPPILAAALRESLAILAQEPERRERLAALVQHAGRRLGALPGAVPAGTQILPLIVGADGAALDLAQRLARRGFDVRAIRPPTVPEGTARLRISITLNATAADVDALADALAEALAAVDRGRATSAAAAE
ncbi:MAG TPA: 8-amino-7-oxononanoate synthase [Steroidobacteraceae bacterium]|nr:8-amino-7-oxononanoate synthase [Steroidobacteraceae bacterium]